MEVCNLLEVLCLVYGLLVEQAVVLDVDFEVGDADVGDVVWQYLGSESPSIQH